MQQHMMRASRNGQAEQDSGVPSPGCTGKPSNQSHLEPPQQLHNRLHRQQENMATMTTIGWSRFRIQLHFITLTYILDMYVWMSQSCQLRGSLKS